jgi:uroporphyrin-III C-methyltransferase
MHATGNVSIVGAGPGAPDLITVRGLARLRAADTLVYDRLVSPELVAEAPRHAELVFVGKWRGAATLAQRAIEELLIARARRGQHVVRLKGGDPFVFGRGGEEVAALAAAGIPVEVVPGVTSATAVPASAGIPVTHRELASALTIVTGHENPGKAHSALDWHWLAAAPGTLVILMGLERLGAISDRLLRAGRAPDTPAAAIAAGTLPEQRVVSAPLAELADATAAAGLRAPTLIVIGAVARFPELLRLAALADPLTGAAERVASDARELALPALG